MEVTTEAVNLGTSQMLVTNESGDPIHIGEFGQDEDTWFTLTAGNAVSLKSFNHGVGVVSDGVSEVGVLYGGTGIFPPAVDLGDVDLSGVQPLDADLTAIAALGTTSYGRSLLTLANALAADWTTDAEVSAALASLAAETQPLDADLTAIAGLATTSYGRAFLALANQAALVALLPSYQPLDSDLTAIAALSTTSFGRAVLALADAAALGAYVGTAVYGQVQTINPQVGTAYTLVAADAGKMVTLSNAAPITLTLPQDSDATIAIGTYVDLFQLGAGQVTVAAGSGATLRNPFATAKARVQYSSLGVQKILANTWRLFGDTASS